MHWPGIEPGPPAWQARILPLNHQCICKGGTQFTVYIHTVCTGATNWLSNESFTPQLAADVQQAFESALTTKDDHDKGLVLLKKRHAELPDTHGGSSEGHKKKKRKHERKKHSPSPLPSGLYIS